MFSWFHSVDPVMQTRKSVSGSLLGEPGYAVQRFSGGMSGTGKAGAEWIRTRSSQLKLLRRMSWSPQGWLAGMPALNTLNQGALKVTRFSRTHGSHRERPVDVRDVTNVRQQRINRRCPFDHHGLRGMAFPLLDSLERGGNRALGMPDEYAITLRTKRTQRLHVLFPRARHVLDHIQAPGQRFVEQFVRERPGGKLPP